jgi:recombination protein RecT
MANIQEHKSFLMREDVQKNISELLGNIQKSKQFTTALLQIVNGSNLVNADPQSVYIAAMNAATLNLNVNPLLGHCYFIGFKNNRTQKTDIQFILGYKGLIQLAIRSGQYKSIDSMVIYENEEPKWDKLTAKLSLNGKDGTGKVSGFYAYFETNNGFFKSQYWTVEKVTKHAKKYSKQKDFKTGELSNVWKNEFESMGCKTVLNSILKKYGIVSIEMEGALTQEIETETNQVEEITNFEIVNQESDLDFLKRSIAEAKNESDLEVIKQDVKDFADVELITSYNLKATQLELHLHSFIEV